MKKLFTLVSISLAFASSAQINLEAGLLAYYPYTNDSRTDIISGAQASVNGNVTTTNDRFGNPNSAYYFSNGRLNSNIQSVIFTDFTVAFWFQSGNLISQKIFQWFGSNNMPGPDFKSFDYSLYTENESGASFNASSFNAPFNNCGANYGPQTAVHFMDNAWHLAILSVGGGIMKLNIDTVLLSQATLPDECEMINAGVDLQAFIIGSSMVDFADANIDDVMLYNRVITSEEIAALYTMDSSFSLSGAGVAENKVSTNVSVFPNPSTGLYTIELSDYTDANIEVYNVLGKKVKTVQQTATKTTVDLTGSPKGVYFVNIRSNGELISKKIILE